jgi:hypothetical protein
MIINYFFKFAVFFIMVALAILLLIMLTDRKSVESGNTPV